MEEEEDEEEEECTSFPFISCKNFLSQRPIKRLIITTVSFKSMLAGFKAQFALLLLLVKCL